jgi:Zn-dependent peptidase ImmA (M78 family)
MAVVVLKTNANIKKDRQLINSLDDLCKRLEKAELFGTPVDIEGIAEFLGLEISEEIMEDDISGYLEFKDGAWVIGVNSLHHINRRRFTIAHEIAHFILHRDPNRNFVDVVFARRRDDATAMEKEADDFAAKLLMPAEKLRAEINNGQTSLQALASLFKVSALAMKYRVQTLGYSVK